MVRGLLARSVAGAGVVVALVAPPAAAAPSASGSVSTSSVISSAPRALPGVSRVNALTLLRQLRVRSEANAGYRRTAFVHWIDADGDGCDTRREVLIAESFRRVRTGASCRLYGGLWRSPYDGRLFTAYGGLDIDHTVPLEEAWASGARSWTAATRRAYANDLGYPYTLTAITAAVNRSKGAKEPGSWLPPLASARCPYVAMWVAVKWRWSLSVDPSEKAGLARRLSACGTRALIQRPARATVRSGSGPTSPAPVGGLDPRFITCTAAKAAGYGPYYRGRDPEYSWYTDRDHDGVVCE